MKRTLFTINEDVSVSCEIGEIEVENSFQSIGYFKVSGVYKEGSAGSNDAYHILGMMSYAQTRYFHSYWLIDFSELNYVWGDEFDMIWDMGQMEMIDKCATVVGPECWEAISTLSDLNAAPRDCLRNDDTFENLEDAYRYLLGHSKLN